MCIERQGGVFLKRSNTQYLYSPFFAQKALLPMSRVVLVSIWPWAAVGREEETALSITWDTECYRFQSLSVSKRLLYTICLGSRVRRVGVW